MKAVLLDIPRVFAEKLQIFNRSGVKIRRFFPAQAIFPTDTS